MISHVVSPMPREYRSRGRDERQTERIQQPDPTPQPIEAGIRPTRPDNGSASDSRLPQCHGLHTAEHARSHTTLLPADNPNGNGKPWPEWETADISAPHACALKESKPPDPESAQ